MIGVNKTSHAKIIAKPTKLTGLTFWSDIGVAVEHLCEMANMFSKKLSRRAFFITNQSMDETKYDFCMSLEVLNV